MTKYALCALALPLAAAWGTPVRADEAGIQEFVATYVEAFNKQDLDSLAAMWAPNATHTDLQTGERTEGREAIQADIAATFKQSPDTRLAGRVDRVRLITADVASVQGQTSVGAAGEEPAQSRFSAILVNQSGQWTIASIEEMPVPRPSTPYDALRKLEWLVGKWVDASDAGRIDTTVRWSTNRAFLIRSYRVVQEDQAVQEGTQVIGWDPRAGQIRSWTFNSDGSFGDGVWTRSDEDWLIKSTQTLADGQAASGTYVLSRPNDDTISLRLIGHEVEGEPVPKSATVQMTRVLEEPASTEAAGDDSAGAKEGTKPESTGAAKTDSNAKPSN